MVITGTGLINGILTLELRDPLLRAYRSTSLRRLESRQISDDFRYSPALLEAEHAGLVVVTVQTEDEASQSDLTVLKSEIETTPFTGTLVGTGEVVLALGNVTGAKAVDVSSANIFTATITGETTWTFTNPKSTGTSSTITIVLTNGGSATQNWPSGTVWAGGTPATLTTSGVDILTFATINGGSTWFAVLAGADFK